MRVLKLHNSTLFHCELQHTGKMTENTNQYTFEQLSSATLHHKMEVILDFEFFHLKNIPMNFQEQSLSSDSNLEAFFKNES